MLIEVKRMNEQERGQLLVDQEKAEERIQQLKRDLRRHADNYADFAQRLRSQPEKVIFSNAPDNLGTYGMEAFGAPAMQWEELDVLRQVAQKIQDLRAAQQDLRNIQSKLSSRY